METNKIRAVVAVLATTFFWGLSFSSTKVLLTSLTAIQIAFFRLILASAVLGLVFFMSRSGRVSRSDLPRMLAGGVFGIFLYFILENNGLRFTTAGTGSLIIATIPVLNVLAGVFFFREKNSWAGWVGVTLSFLGAWLLIRSGSGGALSLADMRGNLLVFGAACSWVVFTRINEPLMQKYNSLTINLYQSVAGMALLGLFIAPAGVNTAQFTGNVLFNLAYLGIFCSAVAYFLYLYALKTLGSSAITCFLNLVPVFGVLGGAVILKEALGTGQILGGLVVITGVTLVTMAGKPADKPKTIQATTEV
ncbi:DMT family transporter [Dethiobacter alkaliphilus]|uniref:DMT family transporter n=1 Tax=Dethiobacter alkaliphilus TaxID=427926 RepID=UPI0022270039|nr:DMT family transporter [Dethiobacter alkaliphilus]MCW3491163.1 DMT family transporter [Dethiobacter alkaliphilus]